MPPPDPDRNPADGYRANPGPGPRLRTDIVDVYVFCHLPASSPAKPPKPLFAPPGGASRSIAGVMESAETGTPVDRLFLLQLLRTRLPLNDTWHPVMGHVDAAPSGVPESAVACATRELAEEVGLDPFGPDCLGFWALEQVHPFFVAEIDCVVLSPRFAAQVRPDWSPKLNHEHAQHRWVDAAHARHAFMWPGQNATIREIRESLMPKHALSRDALRIRSPRA